MCTTLKIFIFNNNYYDHISNSLKNINDGSIIESVKNIQLFKSHALFDYFYQVEDLIVNLIKMDKVDTINKITFIPPVDIIQICKTYYSKSITDDPDDDSVIVKLYNDKELRDTIFEYHKLMYNWILSSNLIIINDFITYHTKHNLYYFDMFKNKVMFKTVIDNFHSEIECNDFEIISKFKKIVINNSKLICRYKIDSESNIITTDSVNIRFDSITPYIKYTIIHKEFSKLSYVPKIISVVYYDIFKKWLLS